MPEKRRCRVCGAEISMSANICPKCGAKQSRPLLVLIMVVAFIVIFIVEMSIMSKNRDRDQADSVTAASQSDDAS
ncbi:MAG: zinc-ribbon domain-containing protein [Oscillospiraceae bacterium]|nr:zinc-ribbon domain-containing protein [Oscillospiraceae bacterium]